MFFLPLKHKTLFGLLSNHAGEHYHKVMLKLLKFMQLESCSYSC